MEDTQDSTKQAYTIKGANNMIIKKSQLEVYRACSKDAIRPVLQAIHITPDYVEATNGFEMVRIHHDSQQDGESFLLSMNDAKKIIAMLPKGVEAIDISLESKELILVKSIDPDDRRIMPWRCYAVEGNFPTLDVVTMALDNPLQARCVLSVEQLTKVLETIKKAGHNEVELSLHNYEKEGLDIEKWLLTPVCVRSWRQSRLYNNQLDAVIMPIQN